MKLALAHGHAVLIHNPMEVGQGSFEDTACKFKKKKKTHSSFNMVKLSGPFSPFVTT